MHVRASRRVGSAILPKIKKAIVHALKDQIDLVWRFKMSYYAKMTEQVDRFDGRDD
jgi:hypothetical protein